MPNGLIAALLATAGRLGADLGPVEPQSPAGQLTTARLESPRGGISVLLCPSGGRFAIDFYGAGHPWASGTTDDLDLTVQAIDAWRSGMSLRDLHGKFPFMVYSELAQAFDDGDPVATRWRQLLDDADLDEIRPLLQAVHGDPQLRTWFPMVSKSIKLRLIRNVARGADGAVSAIRQREGSYFVESLGTPGASEAQSVDEAVAEMRKRFTG